MLKEILLDNSTSLEAGLEALSSSIYTYPEDDMGVLYDEYPVENFNWSTGCTKVCLIFRDFVLKKGFAGHVLDQDEDGEFIDEPEFVDWDFDYCKIEYDLYEMAIVYGVEEFFAEIISLKNSTYAQEKCDITFEDYDCSMYPDEYFERKKYGYAELRKVCEDGGVRPLFTMLSHDAMEAFLTQYSLEELKKLQNFLIDFDINDLHQGNFGFFNGKLKFFDFAGIGTSTYSKIKNYSDSKS